MYQAEGAKKREEKKNEADSHQQTRYKTDLTTCSWQQIRDWHWDTCLQEHAGKPDFVSEDFFTKNQKQKISHMHYCANKEQC